MDLMELAQSIQARLERIKELEHQLSLSEARRRELVDERDASARRAEYAESILLKLRSDLSEWQDWRTDRSPKLSPSGVDWTVGHERGVPFDA